MPNIFLIADTHFGHRNAVKWRPFDTIEEHDEYQEKRWNEVVRPEDRVYLLGDAIMNQKALPIFDRLRGRKVLIKGNHDIGDLKNFAKYFDDIRAIHTIDKAVMTHVPIHPDQLYRWEYGNIHGHLHDKVVLKDGVPDLRYFCVSAEQVNYYPTSYETIKSLILDRMNFNERLKGSTTDSSTS